MIKSVLVILSHIHFICINGSKINYLQLFTIHWLFLQLMTMRKQSGVIPGSSPVIQLVSWGPPHQLFRLQDQSSPSSRESAAEPPRSTEPQDQIPRDHESLVPPTGNNRHFTTGSTELQDQIPRDRESLVPPTGNNRHFTTSSTTAPYQILW